MRGRPGSSCPKGYLVSNTEFTETPICTASRQYQKLKIDELGTQSLDEVEYKNFINKMQSVFHYFEQYKNLPVIAIDSEGEYNIYTN
jgi:hypothetical protein